MTAAPVLIDTNVVVAGVLTADSSSPTARILDGMLAGKFRCLLSLDVVGEYREVLLRARIQRRHLLSSADVDVLSPRGPSRTSSATDAIEQILRFRSG